MNKINNNISNNKTNEVIIRSINNMKKKIFIKKYYKYYLSKIYFNH